MNGYSIQQQLVSLLSSSLRASALPSARQQQYSQMLKLLTEQTFPEGEAETTEAMAELAATVRAELERA
jgi:hypothetical protein